MCFIEICMCQKCVMFMYAIVSGSIVLQIAGMSMTSWIPDETCNITHTTIHCCEEGEEWSSDNIPCYPPFSLFEIDYNATMLHFVASMVMGSTAFISCLCLGCCIKRLDDNLGCWHYATLVIFLLYGSGGVLSLAGCMIVQNRFSDSKLGSAFYTCLTAAMSVLLTSGISVFFLHKTKRSNMSQPVYIVSQPTNSPKNDTSSEDRAASVTPSNDRSASVTPSNDRSASVTPSNDRSASVTPSNDRSASGTSSKDRAASGTPSYDRAASGTSSKDRAASETPSYDRAASGTSSKDRIASGTSSNDRATSVSSSYNATTERQEIRFQQTSAAVFHVRETSGFFVYARRISMRFGFNR